MQRVMGRIKKLGYSHRVRLAISLFIQESNNYICWWHCFVVDQFFLLLFIFL